MLLSFMLRNVRRRRILRGGADDDSDSSGSELFGPYVTRFRRDEDSDREDSFNTMFQDMEEEKISNALEDLRQEEEPPEWAKPYLDGSSEPDDRFLRLYEEWHRLELETLRQNRINNALSHISRVEHERPDWVKPYLDGSLEPDDRFLELYEEWVKQLEKTQEATKYVRSMRLNKKRRRELMRMRREDEEARRKERRGVIVQSPLRNLEE